VRRRALLALTAVLPATAAAQQAQTAQQFLQSIYDPYRKADFKGHDYTQPRRFFTADLAQAMERDFREAKARNEVPKLNGDPFLDAQEWQISSHAIATSTSADGTQGAGAVSFVSFGKPRAMALTLSRTAGDWRIVDIVGANGSLRRLYGLR